ncbi:ThiJ/PfpI family protein [Photobacterium marinum]|uniref:ThiJ/PfpI family protein n=1 Tax=Photobacterium marinum TaxID=1056511 RepID=L8JAM0_9GAMM|nr:DJ-1/PfpI family protein [Photobacterium marinum]ELR65826.1 ThiJ/PfpI family protein [Photobacterium marinum]
MSENQPEPLAPQFTVTALLYDEFDLLEVAGPLEMFGLLPEYFTIQLVSQHGKPVCSKQGPQLVADYSVYHTFQTDILLVPGGPGAQDAIRNTVIMNWLQQHSSKTDYICSICTGAALLAHAGLLKEKAATTNKKRYRWVTGFGSEINWYPVARWVKDGRIYTSSGISAGIDVSLAIISQLLNEDIARKTAIEAEYIWVNDPTEDPFAPLHIVQ